MGMLPLVLPHMLLSLSVACVLLVIGLRLNSGGSMVRRVRKLLLLLLLLFLLMLVVLVIVLIGTNRRGRLGFIRGVGEPYLLGMLVRLRPLDLAREQDVPYSSACVMATLVLLRLLLLLVVNLPAAAPFHLL